MKGFISPEIRSYTSDEILEMIGPGETQYALTIDSQLGTLPPGSSQDTGQDVFTEAFPNP